jgi:hypothetical protein
MYKIGCDEAYLKDVRKISQHFGACWSRVCALRNTGWQRLRRRPSGTYAVCASTCVRDRVRDESEGERDE